MQRAWTRRHWMVASAAAGSSLALAGRAAQASAGIKVLETRVISVEPDYYHGWPTLARRRNGDLLVSYSGSRHAHVCPFGRVGLMRSHDDGQTWTYPEVLLDGPIDDRDSGVLETDKGTILVTSFSSLAYQPILERQEKLSAGASGRWSPEQLQRWQAAHRRVSASERQTALDVWMTRSTDGGLTWSGRYQCQVNSPHGPIQGTDGRLLYAGKELWKGEHRVGVCESTDDGQSWQWLATIPTRPGDQAKDYHELHAVQATDGTLIVQIRNHNKNQVGETLQAESHDDGKTWSDPHGIGVWGLPSHLLRLRDGRLLMTYGYRRRPYGNQARLSTDHGKTWSEPLTVSQDGPSSDLGYPSTVELTGNELLTVWYERPKDSPRAVLRQARWNLA